MIVTMMFILTGLTILFDIAMLTAMWQINMKELRNIKRYLTNEQEEREINQTMEEIEVL